MMWEIISIGKKILQQSNKLLKEKFILCPNTEKVTKQVEGLKHMFAILTDMMTT